MEAAARGFFEAAHALDQRVEAVHWTPLALAVLCHAAKLLARSRAWRNILAAAYPQAHVRWRDALAGYAAGAGGNTLAPARAGDALRLAVVHRRILGATYPTLAATLLVETIFDAAIAVALVAWAVHEGVLTLSGVQSVLPVGGVRPEVAAAVAGAVAVPAAFAAARAPGLRRLGRRLALGLAVLSSPRRYLLEVVPWQALSWALRVLSVACFLTAFGLEPTAVNALRVQVAETLASAVPVMPSGLAAEQALAAYVLRGEAPLGSVLGFAIGMKVVLVAVNVAAAAVAVGFALRTVLGPGALRRARVGVDVGGASVR
jgi:uncharacterized membrane protein YbhN (UPF0104 family)